MKAITTTYMPPTDTDGAYIAVTAEGVEPISIPYDYEADTEACHRKAARALMNKMGWDYYIETGGTLDGYVHVMIPKEKYTEEIAGYAVIKWHGRGLPAVVVKETPSKEIGLNYLKRFGIEGDGMGLAMKLYKLVEVKP